MAAGEPPARTALHETWDLPADTAEVADAREHVRKLAETVFGYGERTEDVRLAAGELLNNAVLHGDGPTVYVTVRSTTSALRVEVRDSGCADSPHIPETPLNDHGRGLTIVGAFTDQWGSFREAGTRCVWFERNFEAQS